MGKFINPILFSSYFGIDPGALDASNLIDPFVNVDLELFIDPVLLHKSNNDVVAHQGVAEFNSHFQNFIKLLAISRKEEDAAWKAAARLLDLKEPPENGLGYGGASRSGSSRPEEIRMKIMRTTKEIITLGSDDPDVISFMGFFEEGVGADTVSDFTTRVIYKSLAKITHDFCDIHGVSPRKDVEELEGIKLPVYTDIKGRDHFFVLVPKDIVRDLPIANDWSDVTAVVLGNSKVRDRVNSLFGNIATVTVKKMKEVIREAALSSPEFLKTLVETVKENASSYDPALDALGYYHYRNMLLSNLKDTIPKNNIDIRKGPAAIRGVVLEALDLFKQHVEVGDLWTELWADGKPKKERAAQLMFQAVADAYCKANNVDMSPEANMGGGPVDFKFSDGYEARVLVEIKRDSGTVVHGYEKQLEHYKAASQTFYGIFVVMNFGSLGSKLSDIREIQKLRMAAGEPASDIVVIDARPRASASKRR